MNKTLAAAAIAALTKDGFTDDAGRFHKYPEEKNLCQMWVRLVIETVYGLKYATFRAASARLAALAWKSGGFAKPPASLDDYPLIGDVLYKTEGSGGAGHVGIYVGDVPGVGNDLVAENSSVHSGEFGARGYRTIDQFGHVDLVVRLPDPNPTPETWSVVLASQPQKVLASGLQPGSGGTGLVRVIAEALGATLTVDAEDKRIFLNPKE